MYLRRSDTITNEKYHKTVGEFANRISSGNESLIDYLARGLNPLTSQEAQRFRDLVNKACNREWFTHPEVQEYDRLIKKVQAELPDDPRIWPLVALGAFLSGLYVGQRQEEG